MKFLCDNCEKYPCDDTEIKLMKYCPVYSPKSKPFGNGIDVCPVCGKPSIIGKPQTNADRIRAMTDEEVAEILDKTCPPNKDYSAGCFINIYGSEDEKDCYRCWLEWLKKESE